MDSVTVGPATWDDFGCVTVHPLPIKDYPLILTFGEFYQEG